MIKDFIINIIKKAAERDREKVLGPFGWLGAAKSAEEEFENKRRRTVGLTVAVSAASALIFIALCISGSSKPDLEDLLVRPLESEGSRELSLHLKLSYLEESKEGDVNVSVLPEGFKSPDSGTFDYETDYLTDMSYRFVSEASENSSGSALMLPSEIEGVSAEWSLPEEGLPVWVLCLGAFAAYAVYSDRNSWADKRYRKMTEDFEKEIPSMVLQLTLFLNAGLVVSSAFEELIKVNSRSENPLYRVLAETERQSRESNVPFVDQLYSYSQSCPLRSFRRFATMVYEQSSTGSALAEKLERERESMWSGRMNDAKTKAGEADTKLCFPLMLLLLALVTICACPALMTM